MKGALAEARALAFLQSQGYTFIKKNHRIRSAEIDLIFQKEGVWVFVEVKHRSKPTFGSALETLSQDQARRIRQAALDYLKRDDLPCRFDLISIDGDVLNGKLHWVQDAF
ncbi:MAG: YraN family protein [Deinococcaceae bacterium]